MFNYPSIICVSIYLFFLTTCDLVQTQKVKIKNETCINDRSTADLQVCYFNDIFNSFSLVWFTSDQSVNDTFDSYRFILRTIDDLFTPSVSIEILTNFTALVDSTNSLRIFNLESGLYEVCVEFQSNRTSFIYKPRDGCISIRIGKSENESFEHTSTQLFIALATGIVLFFILGLVVQRVKVKRRKHSEDDNKPRSRSSSVLSTTSLRQQRDRLVRSLFHHHIEQPRISSMRQWARNRAFRHRIATQTEEFDKSRSLRQWSRHFFTSTDRLSQSRLRADTLSHDRFPMSEPTLTTNNIYTIPDKEQDQIPSRKVSFHLLPPEEYEMV